MKKILRFLFVLYSFSVHAQQSQSQSQSWNALGHPGFSAGNALTTNMVIDKSGTPYLVYQDGIDGPAMVMKFYNNSWVAVGNPDFSAGSAKYTSIVLNSDGIPYAAYMDGAHNSRATVMKYNGDQWVAVGNPGFSTAAAQYTSIAIDPYGTPYVVYQDGDSGKLKATVMKYDSDSAKWIAVGNKFFSSATAQYTSIAIDGNGTPYVAYEDGASGPATVMKYDGHNWAAVGMPGFSAGRAKYLSLALDKFGTPYVAYLDAGNASKATVAAYVDTGWVTVGKAGFSPGQVYYISLALDSAGIPYVAYSDNSDSNKTTVMKYDGYTSADWQVVGTAGFSSAWAWTTSIALSNGIPYVAYSDLGYDYRATVMKLSPFAAGVKGAGISTSALTIFPNPNHGSFTLRISAAQKENAKIVVTNILGEKVKELTSVTNTETQIQLDSAPGIYFVSAVTGEGSVVVRIVVE